MALNIDAKFEGKLTCAFKNDMRNLANFHQSTWKSQNWDFDGILLSKVENAWAWDFLGSYVSWEWRMVQKLKRNWFLSSKLIWAIWRILIQDLKILKNLYFNGLPMTKVYNVWPKKVQGSYIWWNGILIQNLKKNYCFQKWHKEFAKCLPEHLEVSKFELWWHSFKSKVENVWA